MKSIILKLLIVLTILFLGNNALSAQVTIGSDKSPVSGALLQLKEFEPTDPRSDGKTTATRGLLMPRVELIAVDGDLATTMGLTAGSLDKDSHVGLVIYNIKGDPCSPISSGIYVWNGDFWQYLGVSDTDQTSFDPATEILTDYEGNKYTTKVFGTKRWMTQNLRSIRRADGTCIDGTNGMRFNPARYGIVLPAAQITVKSSIPSGNVTYTENTVVKTITNDTFVSIHGLMYTWSQASIACPAGWHLSTEQDWTDLATTLGGTTNLGAKLRGNAGYSYKASDNGSALVWGAGDPVVTTSGFNSLPSGWVRDDGVTAAAFSNSFYIWSASSGIYRHSGSSSPGVTVFSGNLQFRFAVRCVQN